MFSPNGKPDPPANALSLPNDSEPFKLVDLSPLRAAILAEDAALETLRRDVDRAIHAAKVWN